MEIQAQRIAIVFDNRIRPETTGTYCYRALKQLVNTTHYLPDQLSNTDFSSFDLVLHIDDGLRYPLPKFDCCTAYWAIDTHVDFEWALKRSRSFDFVFVAQRDGAEKLKQSGVVHAEWLPLACDPEIHGSKPMETQYDISFVGNFFPGERGDLIQLLTERYPNSFFGQTDYREMSALYSKSKIIFNRSIKNDINMRVFEALASGSLLITNELDENGLSSLFQDELHLVTYQCKEELIQRIDFYLDHENERERIARNGCTEVLKSHTYKDRMQTILDIVNSRQLQRDSENPSIEQQTHSTVETSTSKQKNRAYFEFPRPEVQALVPENARRILDIGCGTGRLGEGLKQKRHCHVTGVELDAVSATRAAERIDLVIQKDLEAADFDFQDHQFDCVICADILEHLREPGVLLEKIRRWLEPDGSLILSIPNVRHHSVITSLLAGNWTYESAGLLDNDHVRFFTRREIEKLLFRSGFDVNQFQAVWGPGDQALINNQNSKQVNISGLQISAKTEAEANEFYTYQYLLSARPRDQHQEQALTSIIIVTHNQLSYTHQCIESIQLYTDEPYELIFVDNGSTDGTPDYLKNISEAQVILNDENLGFPAAVNQGIDRANGSNIVLLNNDTIVTTGWLHHLLAALSTDKTIGLVGACSNNVSGPQQVTAGYAQLNELDGFAWDRGQALAGRITDLERLVGFCMLIRREVIDDLGKLDEQFGIGMFEDDDYCQRARSAGYRTVVAEAAFVHHFGSVTFKATGINFSQLLTDNQQKYEKKWPSQNDNSLNSKKSTVSLCMIVRDNETIIRDALKSVKPWVDEMIVVDTGSLDRTSEIAESLGAQVYHFPWCDDFSAARNESLKYASGDWIFWMDSDDIIDEEQGQKLRELVNSIHQENILGYVMQVHCPSKSLNGEHQDITVVDHIKLFRNRPDLRFEHRIHEQIIPAIRHAKGDVAWTDIFVVHAGSDQSEQGKQRKLERDFHLLSLDLKEHPDHPFVLFNLGMTLADSGQHVDAISHLTRCLEVSAPHESHVRKAYALLVSSLQKMERHNEAAESCRQGLQLFPDDPELLFRNAMLHHHFGNYKDAEESYRSLLTSKPERHFSSTDQGIFGFKAKHNLAVVLADQQKWKAAAEIWKEVTREEPHFLPGWRGLAEMYQHLKDNKGLSELIEELEIHPELSPDEVLSPIQTGTQQTTGK